MAKILELQKWRACIINGTSEGMHIDEVRIKRALVSVNDKEGIVELVKAMMLVGVEVLSTGGTAKVLQEAGLNVIEVSDYTNSTEILDGRVKTLHPMIHGGLLAVRGNFQHELECRQHGIGQIDLLVMNLYPFEEAVKAGSDFETCIENIDIGGPAMLRAGAKNHNYVTVLTKPYQYEPFLAKWCTGRPRRKQYPFTTLEDRRAWAVEAFKLSAHYDKNISNYMEVQHQQRQASFSSMFSDAGSTTTATTANLPQLVVREYAQELKLKYGTNQQQVPAAIYSISKDLLNVTYQEDSPALPFTVLNGTPGYVNLLDAMYGWQLVREVSSVLHAPAAASYKHCSPAGAAVGTVPLSQQERLAYEIPEDLNLTPTALAYIRARNADPLCSFGDFAAISSIVDACTALLIKPVVCDGIIAPGFEAEALRILKTKKRGAFIILQASTDYIPPVMEYRELFGAVFAQRRNDSAFSEELLNNIVVAGPELQDKVSLSGALDATSLPASAKHDMILASIALKYTQSNSVIYALNGQLIGVGAGQQSRVDCVKLAGRKAAVWFMRQYPKVQDLAFKPEVRKQDKINARVRFIDGDITTAEYPFWSACFEQAPPFLLPEEKNIYLTSMSGISISSDAFFPFRDSIDHASKIGVCYVVQPGGSVADEEVMAACEEYGMTMIFTGLRLFLH